MNRIPEPARTGIVRQLADKKRQRDKLIYDLIDLNNIGCSIQANAENNDIKEDGGSVVTVTSNVAELLGIDLDKEGKRLKVSVSAYVEDDE